MCCSLTQVPGLGFCEPVPRRHMHGVLRACFGNTTALSLSLEQEVLQKGGIGLVLKTSYDADTCGCSIVRFCHENSPSHCAAVKGVCLCMRVCLNSPHAAMILLTMNHSVILIACLLIFSNLPNVSNTHLFVWASLQSCFYQRVKTYGVRKYAMCYWYQNKMRGEVRHLIRLTRSFGQPEMSSWPLMMSLVIL